MNRRKTLAFGASSLATFLLGVLVAVSIVGSASAASAKKAKSAKDFFVVNGTVNAASDHELLASTAFPNFTTGAIDNYYAMAHAHVDNSPFAEGTASPADTGPIGQTAAAGNFQQPQYADARWPGDKDSGKATYGNQGGPYATATASRYNATADASEASSGMGGPSGPGPIALPKELDDRLRMVLASWKSTWQDRLSPKPPAAPVVPTPKPPAVPTPKAPIVTTPTLPVGGGGQSAPPVKVPSPPVTPPSLPSTAPRSRSLASLSAPADGMSLLESSTLATFERKSGALVLKGESRVGRVSLGGGQIEIKGIHVSASIANDGSPKYKVSVSIAAATIGGVPVTIDEDGVHVAGQGQGLPYQQASDALNSALSHAGIQLFLVGPEITKGSCGQSGSGSGGNTSTTTSSSSSDQSGATGSCDQSSSSTATCDQTGTSTTSTGTTTGTGSTTTTSTPTPTPPLSGLPTPPGGDQSGTTTTPGSCSDMGGGGASTGTPSTCSSASTGTGTTTTTTSNSSTGTTTTTTAVLPTSTDTTSTTTTTTNSSDQTGGDTGASSSGAETVRATGLHVVFTQPGQSGVPGQSVEHILGEVFVDSLAVPAGPLPDLGFSSGSGKSCLGGAGQASGGGSLSGGGSSGSLSSGSTFGSGSQGTSGSTGNSLPAAFAAALRKPLWLLLAYLVWQALVIGTGVSLWNWRRGDPA